MGGSTGRIKQPKLQSLRNVMTPTGVRSPRSRSMMLGMPGIGTGVGQRIPTKVM